MASLRFEATKLPTPQSQFRKRDVSKAYVCVLTRCTNIKHVILYASKHHT